MHRAVRVIAFALLAVCGCAHRDAPIANLSEYQTTAQDAARRENSAAVALIYANDLAGAERHLRLAIAADPTFGPAHNNLGHVFFLQTRPYEAATAFSQAARLMPRQAEPHNNLGLVFESANKLDDAAESYARAVALDPNNIMYLANSARARVRRGERTSDLRDLLIRLQGSELPTEWTRWASQSLVSFTPISATTAPAP